MRRHPHRFALVLGLCAWALGWAPAAHAADVERVEAIGAANIEEGASKRRSPRDRALRQALAEAVRQVAVAEVVDLPVPPTDEELALVFGDDPYPYASRFRVLEDRGERPSLDPEAPADRLVYVVLAEVHVDAVRVRQRLVEAGLLIVPSGEINRDRVWIAVEDLSSWHEVQAVRELLREVGAPNAVPVEVQRGRALLEVDAQRSPERLLQELVRRAPATLDIQPLGLGRGGLRLRARVLEASPPAARAPSGTFDTPRAERY